MYYQSDSEDSFEDFLEWRKWKKERRRHKRREQLGLVEAPVSVITNGATTTTSTTRSTVGAVRSAITTTPGVVTRNVAVVGTDHGNRLRSDVTRGKQEAYVKDVVPVADGVISSGDQWLLEFNQAGDRGKRELRAAVLEETRSVLAQGWYKKGDRVVNLSPDDLLAVQSGMTVYEGGESFGTFPSNADTTAHFVKADAIETALFLIKKKAVNPLVVVPVDPKNLGGGFAGSSSLEEQVFRRTNALLAFENREYRVPENGAILLPNVLVFRESETKDGYSFFDQPRKVSLLFASAPLEPEYEPKGRSYALKDENVARSLKEKIRLLLGAGLKNGHNSIVLTAFGSGHNKIPPEVVSAIFRDLLTTEFSNTYKHVTFAILEDANCGLEHNPRGNLRPFQNEFLSVSNATGSRCC